MKKIILSIALSVSLASFGFSFESFNQVSSDSFAQPVIQLVS